MAQTQLYMGISYYSGSPISFTGGRPFGLLSTPSVNGFRRFNIQGYQAGVLYN